MLTLHVHVSSASFPQLLGPFLTSLSQDDLQISCTLLGPHLVEGDVVAFCEHVQTSLGVYGTVYSNADVLVPCSLRMTSSFVILSCHLIFRIWMKHWRWKLFRFFPAKSLWIIFHHHTGPIDFGIVSQQSRHIVPHSFLQLLRGAHCLLDIIVDIGGKGHLVPDVGISGQVKCLYFEVGTGTQ